MMQPILVPSPHEADRHIRMALHYRSKRQRARRPLEPVNHPPGMHGHAPFRRFSGIARIGRNILTGRLQLLIDEGLLTRTEYQPNPPRFEYRLTDKGRDVYPILAAMAAWGDKWLVGPEGSPLTLHHDSCGNDMHAVVGCSECGQPLHVRAVKARPGPGYPRG